MTSKMIAEDWIAISRAVEYYNGLGYQYIDVPWMVDESTSAITCPEGYAISTGYGTLVGSAEQGFLQMIEDENLEPGSYMSVSPCFRNETEDETHQPYFMKLELFKFLGDTVHLKRDLVPQMFRMTDDAKAFLGGKNVQIDHYSEDLMLNNIEI